jgi:hypothetical protein
MGVAYTMAVLICAGCSATRPRSIALSPSIGRHYDEVSLDELLQHPRRFDGDWVRVRGIASLRYEGTSLWIGRVGGTDARDYGRSVWLSVGWPLPASVLAFNGTTVIVEARFNANEHGHMGLYPGTLGDIRAMWQPGRESAAYVLNRETRPDALEQLEFKTGWVLLGILDEDGRVDAADGSSPGHLPDVGARMRLCRNSALYIVAYARDGEARRMEAPTDATLDSRTRLAVAAGTLVHVDEIHVSEETEKVWARISPPAHPDK